MVQTSFSQEIHSRITIINPSQDALNVLAQQGIDLKCGISHGKNNSFSIDISNVDRSILDANGISYAVVINNVSAFYNQRAVNDLPAAMSASQLENAKTIASRKNDAQQKSSISSSVLDNYLQYNELNEKDWVKPLNFELGTMGGCLTVDAMEAELDQMRSYSQSNGLNIVSVKQDASTTGITTWGNPSGTISNNGLTYTGQGGTRWNPKTMYYVRITGDESSTVEGSKPQMLFTSMIHAREVSALMNNMYFMWYVIENYNTDPAIKNLVDNNELYFIPVVNPDGLRWNEHIDSGGGQMQRKNLRPNTGGTGNTSVTRGVDINRNFDYFWGSAGTGSSGTPSSDSYRGPSPESEPETQIIKEFVQSRNFKTAIWNHSFANSIPHPYGGNPSFVSGREDEMHEMHADMTKYNRYVSGATIFSPSNGIADDWMLGGSADSNGSIGSGKNVLATTPEHGSEWFWPTPSTIIPIAQRSMRISLMGAYHGGQYAKFHDLTQSDISSTSANLDFGIERIGQTASDFTIMVTPISANITNIVSPSAQSGMTVLEQRNVSAALTLDPSIQPNDKIEYKVELSNDAGVFYEIDIEKYYQPTVLLFSDPQVGFSDWNNTGWNRTSTGGYTGNRAFRTGDAVPYANNTTKTMTTVSGFDLSNSDEVLVQFYSKWDIERNFDLIEFQASTNGTTWTTLNGKYTKPKSSADTNDHVVKSATNEAFQGNNSSGHIYDGDQMDNWVMEEIVIDGSNNSPFFGASNVLFRFRMRSDTNNVFENYSANAEGFYVDDFKVISLAIPCTTSIPISLAANTITAFTADITWDNIPSATYDIRYRETTSPTWVEVTDLLAASYSITGLEQITDYEVQVRSRCTSTTSDYSASVNFTTTDLTYCTAIGDSIADEYIGGVTLNGTLNDTSSSTTSGYSDLTGSTIFDPIQIGSTGNSIAVSKFWNGSLFDESVSVWIDFNKNGSFEGSEKILEDGANQTTPVSDTFTVPLSAATGNTRMRVLMKYSGTPGSIQDDACEDFQYGEVEDYDVYLYDGLLYTSSTWYPNAPNGSTGLLNTMILDGIYNANTNISINNITVNTGAEINVNKANAITVNGNIINNGEFIMNSDSNEFSSLLLEGSASGDLKYNRYVNSNTNRNDLVSPPFSGESFVDFLSNNTNVLANPTETLYLFGPFDKSVSDYLTFSNTETTPLEAGKGYRVASIDANQIFTFTGSATTGNLNVPIFKTGTVYEVWNLIGNPYPSYIKLEDFILANISEFDSESVAVYGYDSDASNGSYWTIWNLAYADANPNTLITPGQGFFVSSKDGGGSVSFTPSMRAAGSSDDFIAGRTTNPVEHGTLLMTSSNSNFSTDVYFTDSATLGLDLGYDASHFDGAPTDFSIYSELVENNTGTDLAIQAISSSDISNNPIIPLGVNLGQGVQVTISLVNSSLNHNIYLEDALTNTFTLLNTSEYTFTAATDLSDTGRFYLRFDANVLSVGDSDLDNIQVYNNSDRKEIIVRGQLNDATLLTLYDIQGREILRNNLNTNTITNSVSTNGYSAGVYLVQLSNSSYGITKKLIIK